MRECHRRGIAVIQDVVYNHYDNDAERAEWQYDSTAPEQNIYYWYEGRPSDYTLSRWRLSSTTARPGYTPRFWEELVRQQFISSAAFLIEEMHVDGLRVDLTQAIHRDNVLEGRRPRSIGSANIFGQKLLREWSRTLHMIRPTAMLIAEDHTGWDAVTKPPAQAGLGFDAHLVSRLLSQPDRRLRHGRRPGAAAEARGLRRRTSRFGIDRFAGALYDSQYRQVVFHESHDEAGNAGGHRADDRGRGQWRAALDRHDPRSPPRRGARVCFGLSLLSAGTPMFFMGEEIGAQNATRSTTFCTAARTSSAERNGNGQKLFRFYQDLITLSRRLRSIRSHTIDILHQSNVNRVIAFKRWSGDEEVIIAREPQRRPVRERICHREGCTRHSRRRLEGNLQ